MAGTTGVVLDAAAYSTLLHIGWRTDQAKTASLLVATIFAYFANRFWTFAAAKTGKGRLLPFITLYATVIALNVVVNHALLVFLGGGRPAYFLAWFIAIIASSCLNYLGMRFFVFRGTT